jgi:hypothetical protein
MSSPEEQGKAEGEPTPEPSPVETQPETDQEPVSQPPKKKPVMPPYRIALLVFVLIAVVAIIFELRARSAYTGTVEAIDQASEEAEQRGDGLYAKDLEELIKGSPKRERNEEKNTEVLTWRGLKAHRLEVQYGAGGFVSSYQTPTD